MALTKAEVTKVQGKFNGAVDALARQEAGEFRGHPDQPMKAFLFALRDVVRNPIHEPAHLDMLNESIAILMAEGPQSYVGTVEEAIEDALREVMDYATPLQQALLALARHRLRQNRLSA